MRCFLALPLPSTVRRQMERVQDELRAACLHADVRWVRPEASHLTLEFLGDADRGRLFELVPALGAEVAKHRIPGVALGGVGAFPSPRRARVLWLGVRQGGPEIVHLADALRRVLEPLGVAADPDPFTPHVTLGRVRAPQRGANLTTALAACAASDAGAWTPDAVVLYQSQLRPAGAMHEAIATFPLG